MSDPYRRLLVWQEILDVMRRNYLANAVLFTEDGRRRVANTLLHVEGIVAGLKLATPPASGDLQLDVDIRGENAQTYRQYGPSLLAIEAVAGPRINRRHAAITARRN